MLRRPRRARAEPGQALTEFALIAPILFLLLFAVLQFGLLFGGQNGLVNGVREATRRAVTYRVNDASLNDPSIEAAVCTAIEDELNAQLERALPGFDPVRLARSVTYDWVANPGPAPTGANPENYFLYVQISARYRHPLYVPLVGIFLDGLDGTTDGALTLTASEQMRVENPSLALGTTPPPCT